MSNSKHLILVVEDSIEDFTALSRAINQVGMSNPLFRCEDGEDALDYLYNRDEFNDKDSYPKPALVILDLNMPGVDGKEVLEVVKKDPLLRKIPIIVFSSSSNLKEIADCYQLGANSYMQKPLGVDGFVKVLRNLNEYWFSTTILPSE